MAEFEGRYSDEDILEQLRDHYKRNDKITRSSFEKDKTVCSSSIVYMRFGSWNNALLKSGIMNNITKESIIENLKSHYLKNRKITKKSFDLDKTVCPAKIVELKFGSWAEGLKAANLSEKNAKRNLIKERMIIELKTPRKREYAYTKGELIGKYRRLKKQMKYKNVKISTEDFYKETGVSIEQIINNVRDWDNFCEIAKPLKREI